MNYVSDVPYPLLRGVGVRDLANRKLKTEEILLGAFVGVESAHAFSAFNPSIFTIRSLAIPQAAENQIRIGYIPSIGFSIALGTIVGAITKSRLPIYFGLGTSAFMCLVYEIALRYPVSPSAKVEEPDTQVVVINGRRFRIVPEN